MRLASFELLSFDCYGTLIDWESGILAALHPLLSRLAAPPSPDDTLALFAQHESAQQAATPAMPYPGILAAVHRRIATELGAPATETDQARFGASVPDWPAFPDSAAALQTLQQHFRLVILSNVDRASFASSNQKLGVEFAAVCTAEDVGAYKPADANFDALIDVARGLGVPPSGILHTAQSLFHDHVPAKRRGLATAWIDRRHDRHGPGATLPVENAAFDLRFPGMAEMADALQTELAAPAH